MAMCVGHRRISITQGSDVDVFFDMRLNKRLSKDSIHRWHQTHSRSLWRHYDDMQMVTLIIIILLYYKILGNFLQMDMTIIDITKSAPD